MNISIRHFEDKKEEYIKIYKWCQNKEIYEWFEQRKLSLEEITNKYRNKLLSKKQDLFIIECDNKDIGYTQIYRFDNDIKVDELNNYQNIYEFDLFIGEGDYLSKGIGKLVIDYLTNYIYSNYHADSIILRPFKRNIRAIKCYQKCNYNIINEHIGNDTQGNKEIILVLLNRR